MMPQRALAVGDPIDELARLIEAEYREMPGLSLTAAQVQRLWNLDRSRCDTVLDRLVRNGVLGRTALGAYRVRAAR